MRFNKIIILVLEHSKGYNKVSRSDTNLKFVPEVSFTYGKNYGGGNAPCG